MNLFEKKRLARSKDKDMVFKFLDARSEKTGFFSSLFDIYTFAIALGVKRRKQSVLSGPTSDPIQIIYFTDEQRKFMDMVIIHDSNGDINKIDKADEDIVKEMVTTIERYANGGLEILLKTIENHPENAFEQILLLLNDELTEEIPHEAEEDISW
ncbi:DNA phosphorothioation-associated protein 4 [Sulfurimonas indica]|uniref:DNA phosphorothioation-associated protein 4 n=1 Tax=Sulfurimonas indica TaxID=2508707 RepID=UPI001264FB11|nr:DNA phosphorothioation-associated protein 4 [Sulfurimonas indica]